MSSRSRLESRARFLSISLTAMLTMQIPAPAQEESQILPPALKIVVAKGEEGTNNIKKEIGVEPLVVVSDEKDLPVSRVMVMFTLPENGPSGVFANGARNLIVYSDAEGRAIARGLRPNHIPGKFQIAVDVSFSWFGGSCADQPNQRYAFSDRAFAEAHCHSGHRRWSRCGGVVAASAGGKSGTSTVTPPTPSTTLSPGTPTFGPPQ